MLDGDRLMALICDGMGSGAAAAGESARAAALIGRCLAAGADWSLAIETVNAMMLNCAPEDMFSTVDLMLLDLSTGMAEFMKLAACPALIVHGETVQRIEGGRLPLGILNRVTPAASRVRLMAGDTVLLASDGVMDAADPRALEALLTAPGDDMNALSEGVMALAQAADGPRDDMTVVCVRLRENDAA
jgi:stage II sporulation protein E